MGRNPHGHLRLGRLTSLGLPVRRAAVDQQVPATQCLHQACVQRWDGTGEGQRATRQVTEVKVR
jgi:hypothetical protein